MNKLNLQSKESSDKREKANDFKQRKDQLQKKVVTGKSIKIRGELYKGK